MGKKVKKFQKWLSLSLVAAMVMAEPCMAAEAAFSDGEQAVTDSFIAVPAEDEIFSSEEEETSERKDEIRYIKDRPLTVDEKNAQEAPFATLRPMQRNGEIRSDSGISTYALYPAKYDARNEGYVTPVKDQSIFNICWAFATASNMETSLLSQGKGAYDLSEEHLAYFLNTRRDDPLGNTPKDRNVHHSGYHEEGHAFLASQFLSTWSGMVTEKEVPLPLENGQWNGKRPYRKTEYHADAYLEDTVFSNYSEERMKALVSEFHSASVMLNMTTEYLNADTAAYCYPIDDGSVNHVVTVVGWDDNYSRRNFPAGSEVKRNGAWIVKNSWGEYWGDDGYFYVSYDDKSLYDLTANTAKTNPKYRNNYFYDGTSGDYYIGLNQGQGVAAVFDVKAASYGKSEVLGEIVTTIYNDNADMEIQIYTDVKDKTNPLSGTPAYKKPVRYTQAFAGIDTIQIPEVNLARETKFAVAITNKGNQPLLFGIEQSANNGWMEFKAGINENQGFIKLANKWYDLYGDTMSPRIKAHTRTVDGMVAIEAPEIGYTKVNDRMFNEINWYSIQEADGYYVYRRVSDGSWKRVGICEGPAEAAYYDKDIEPMTTYEYLVRAYCKFEGKTYLSTRSNTVTLTTTPAPQKINHLSSRSAGMYLRWDTQKGASGYRVYRKDGSSWRMLAELKGENAHSFMDKTAKKGKSYYYAVRAYLNTPKGKLLSRYAACKGTRK